MLTGKTRYRTTWRGRLVLQVEYVEEYKRDLNGSGYYDEGSVKLWRDARVQDLSVGEVLTK